MKRVFLLLFPIFLALCIFSIFSYFLSQSQNGKGALQITSLPLSNVYLNGKLIGKTPLCKCEGADLLPSGEYTVRLVPLAGDNLSPFEEQVSISKAVLTVVDRTFGIGEGSSGFVINLTPLTDKKAVQLFVSSFPTGASVSVDNTPQGTTPVLLKTLTASDHDLTISKSGYKEKVVHIHTGEGYQLNATVTLSILPLDATASAALQSVPLTVAPKQKVIILQTPTGFLRVRSGPSVGASESAQVKPGDSFEYVDEQTGWYEIKLTNGATGWVSADYSEKQ